MTKERNNFSISGQNINLANYVTNDDQHLKGITSCSSDSTHSKLIKSLKLKNLEFEAF